MVDSILHGVDISCTIWVKLVNRYRLLLSSVMYAMREKVVVAGRRGERGERMMVMVRVEDRLGTHTL
jgi:hypothetical protein